jgi:hypothetical protein
VKGLSSVVVVVALSCLLSASGGRAQNLVCSSGKGGWQGTLQRVVVLRPKVNMMKNSPDDVRVGASEQTEAGLRSELARAFVDKGYKLWLDPLLTPEWEQTPPTDAAVKGLKDHFDSLFPKTFFGGPDCKTLSKTSFKNDLEGVTDRKEFDAIVLTRAHGYLLTKADKVMDALGGLAGGTGPGGDLYISLAVVDRSTGTVLYYCESKASGAYVLDPDRLSGPIRKCLKRFSRAANQGSHSEQ